MPTILSHPAVPLALGLGLGRERIPGPLLAAGIAFLWPFSERRFFAPFQVIRVSPLGLSRFLSARGAAVLLRLSLRPPRPADR